MNSSSTQSILCFVRNLASQYNFVFELIELSCFFISYICIHNTIAYSRLYSLAYTVCILHTFSVENKERRSEMAWR